MCRTHGNRRKYLECDLIPLQGGWHRAPLLLLGNDLCHDRRKPTSSFFLSSENQGSCSFKSKRITIFLSLMAPARPINGWK